MPTDLTSARILADSVTSTGTRLTTMLVTFPRFILAEFNTHRAFSRNSASSRAIPVERQISAILENPFVPQRFPLNRPGMSADEYVEASDPEYDVLLGHWMDARDDAIAHVRALLDADVHKQIANRLLEPFMYHQAIVSATDWWNFYELRISEFAQPEIFRLATLMKEAQDGSKPSAVLFGEWHLPLIEEEEREQYSVSDLVRMSVARCAAVSLNRQGDRNYGKEMTRYSLLYSNRHLSPFEHPATPGTSSHVSYGNFKGWQQARWFLEHELPI